MSDSLQTIPAADLGAKAQVVLPPGPMTAEQYGQPPDLGYPTELVRGQIKVMNQPYPEHGEICATITALLRNFAHPRKLGRVVGNDSGVITERKPDTVRGPDVAYYSFGRVPPGRLRKRRYLDVVPELAVEVKSEFDRASEINEKIAEYLKAGVLVVCVVDPDTDSVQVHYPDKPTRVFQRDDELELPEVLPGFRITVRELFEDRASLGRFQWASSFSSKVRSLTRPRDQSFLTLSIERPIFSAISGNGNPSKCRSTSTSR
jgi:Uma2 family endonuclease